MKKQSRSTVQITGSMISGFLIGLPIAAMLAGFISWIALGKQSAKLAGEFGQVQAVIVTESIAAGEKLEPGKLARRPVPRLVVSGNTVSPDEVTDLFGKESLVGFEPGDLLLRSAFGLPPRESPPPVVEVEAEEEPAPIP